MVTVVSGGFSLGVSSSVSLRYPGPSPRGVKVEVGPAGLRLFARRSRRVVLLRTRSAAACATFPSRGCSVISTPFLISYHFRRCRPLSLQMILASADPAVDAGWVDSAGLTVLHRVAEALDLPYLALLLEERQKSQGMLPHTPRGPTRNPRARAAATRFTM